MEYREQCISIVCLRWPGGPLKPDVGLSGDPHWLDKPQKYTLADALKSLKQGVARRLIETSPLKPNKGLNGPPADHFWQKRYYDFNIRSYLQFVAETSPLTFQSLVTNSEKFLDAGFALGS